MKIFIALICLVLQYNVHAQTQIRADKGQSSIKYFMKHALHSWTGTSKELSCIAVVNTAGDIEKVAATVPVKSFNSNNSNRDSHMLEVTDALTYPSISFYSTSVGRNAEGYLVKGKLNFHGVERPLELQMTEQREGSNRKLNGSFIFVLEDHKIERPSLMMMKTDNEVKVELVVSFADR